MRAVWVCVALCCFEPQNLKERERKREKNYPLSLFPTPEQREGRKPTRTVLFELFFSVLQTVRTFYWRFIFLCTKPDLDGTVVSTVAKCQPREKERILFSVIAQVQLQASLPLTVTAPWIDFFSKRILKKEEHLPKRYLIG